MLLDTLANRYGMLPSEVMLKANTFDMFICDTAMSYRQKAREEAMNKNKQPTDYSQAELLDILAQTRGES